MKRHYFAIALLFAFISFNLYAQQEPGKKIRQVGINFSSLNAFGLHYKAGNEKTLFRLSLATVDFVTGDNNLQKHFGGGFRLGFENHVPVSGAFDFIWGMEGGFSVNYLKNNTVYTDIWTMEPAVDVVLGINYTFAGHVVVGAELAPVFEYYYQRAKGMPDNEYHKTDSYFHFGFNSSSAALTVAYRFGR